MEIFVRDAESETGKWRSVLDNVTVCLLTSRPFSLSHRWACFWDVRRHQMAQRYFKIKAMFGLIYRYYIFIPYVESSDETNRLI